MIRITQSKLKQKPKRNKRNKTKQKKRKKIVFRFPTFRTSCLGKNSVLLRTRACELGYTFAICNSLHGWSRIFRAVYSLKQNPGVRRKMCTCMVTLCAKPNTYSGSTVLSDGRTIHVPNLIRGEKKYHPYCLKQGNKLKKVKSPSLEFLVLILV